MSNYFEDKYSRFEYNPCIRKGKHKPKHKKQKKYESKIQKTNLIRPTRHKLVSENFDIIYHNNEIPNDLIKILLNKNATKWNDEYDFLYNHIFHLEDNKELEQYYLDIQRYIHEEYEKSYDEYDEYEEYEFRYQCFKDQMLRYRH